MCKCGNQVFSIQVKTYPEFTSSICDIRIIFPLLQIQTLICNHFVLLFLHLMCHRTTEDSFYVETIFENRKLLIFEKIFSFDQHAMTLEQQMRLKQWGCSVRAPDTTVAES